MKRVSGSTGDRNLTVLFEMPWCIDLRLEKRWSASGILNFKNSHSRLPHIGSREIQSGSDTQNRWRLDQL
jgi:hypothetical protein